jgi:hypothetical protein
MLATTVSVIRVTLAFNDCVSLCNLQMGERDILAIMRFVTIAVILYGLLRYLTSH